MVVIDAAFGVTMLLLVAVPAAAICLGKRRKSRR
jgi:hypothetical protein